MAALSGTTGLLLLADDGANNNFMLEKVYSRDEKRMTVFMDDAIIMKTQLFSFG